MTELKSIHLFRWSSSFHVCANAVETKHSVKVQGSDRCKSQLQESPEQDEGQWPADHKKPECARLWAVQY